jgi:thioredoxin 1
MTLLTLTKDNFEKIIEENDIVFVDFWAQWCGPCLSFASIYEKAASENQDIVFGKVNIEEEPELAQAFKVRSIPLLMVFKKSAIIFSQPGALPLAALMDLVQQAKKVVPA